MKSIKQEVFWVISSLPDNAPIDDVMYRWYIIDKIANRQTVIKDGYTISTEELLKEIESWVLWLKLLSQFVISNFPLFSDLNCTPIKTEYNRKEKSWKFFHPVYPYSDNCH